MPLQLFSKLVLMTLLLTACSMERNSDQQWAHSELSSYAAAFSPDGRYVLVGDTDAPAKLWHIEENRVVYSWQNRPDQAGKTTFVGFSADGKIAVTSEEDIVVLWDATTGEPLRQLTFPVRIKSLSLSPRGDYILLALYDRQAVYFDLVENRVIQKIQHDGAAVNSPNNQLINAVTISQHGYRIWKQANSYGNGSMKMRSILFPFIHEVVTSSPEQEMDRPICGILSQARKNTHYEHLSGQSLYLCLI